MTTTLLNIAILLRRDGWAYRQIARELRIDEKTARTALVRHMGEEALLVRGPQRQRRAAELRAQGESAPAIADQLGYADEPSVYRAIRRYHTNRSSP